MHYDIVIIGGGPAGASAGLALSNFSKSICIIDKSLFPRSKLCAGIITYKTTQIIKKILPEFNLSNYSNTKKISLFSQHNTKCEFTLEYPLILVERKQFDYELLLACKNAGVCIMEQTTFSEFIPDQNKLILMSGEELSYSVLIAADGIFSSIRKKLGIADIQKGFCLQNTINTSQTKSSLANLDKVCFDFANISFGYNWLLSNKNGTVIGTGVLAENTTYKKAFAEHIKLCRQLSIPSSLNLQGAFLPIGDIANQSMHPYNNIILIGDAAGYANPITGEGIYYAILSGYYAGQAYQIDNEHFKNSFLSLISSSESTIKEVSQLSHHFYNEKMINNLINQLKNCPDYISNICDDVFNLERRSYQDFFFELTELFR